MPIYAVKTTASHEDTVAEMIASRNMEGIHAAMSPEDTVSYTMVEAEDTAPIKRVIEDIPHARGMVDEQPIPMSEVEHFFDETSDVENVSEGDLVELTEGPFNGERAQVTQIDSSSEQVTVELHEATVPIPVTVRGDQIRVLDSEDRE